MDTMHPIMHEALRGIIPAGFQSAPVMHATSHLQAINADLRTRLAQNEAPPCPAGQFAFTYQHPELGALECHLEGERGDPDSGQRDTATLYSAYLRGVDISDRLTDDEVEAIETAALKQPKEIQEPA